MANQLWKTVEQANFKKVKFVRSTCDGEFDIETRQNRIPLRALNFMANIQEDSPFTFNAHT